MTSSGGAAPAGRRETGGEAVRRRLEATAGEATRAQARAARRLALETSKTLEVPSRLVFARGEGPWLEDVEGRRFLDMVMGFGAHLLGHRPPEVEAAVAAQLERGWHFGLNNDLQAHMAERIAALGADQPKVLFCGSGSEATAYAMRLARAFTGRDRIAVFDGCYHGSHDYALVKADPGSAVSHPAPQRLGAGVPASVADAAMTVLPYRDPAAFDLIRRRGAEIAGVIVQPVQNSLPRLDMDAFLAGLRAACDEVGALLIFDEVVTGLRLSLRGAQGRFGVRPDITTYGKSLGGGLPIGAVAGREDVMALLPRPNASGGVFSGGTFNANPLTMAAGLATLDRLEREADDFYPRLEAEADRLAAQVNEHAQAHQMPARLLNAASMMCLVFQRDLPENSRHVRSADPRLADEFFLQMLDRGVLMPAQRMVLLSGAHEPEHVDAVASAITGSLDALREDGLV